MEQQKTNALAHDDLVAYLDPSISPTDDFYAHVNKKWCDANPIPPDKSRWGTFYILDDNAKKQIHALLLEIAADDTFLEGSNAQKIRDLYRAGMNEGRIERDHLNTHLVQATLWGIERIESAHDVISMVGRLHLRGVSPFWASFVKTDAKKSDSGRLHFEQAGLSLPDRDYYLKEDDEKFAKVRVEFVRYMEAMHRLLGDTVKDARENTNAVFAIETRLARASLAAVERRDEEKQYHPRTLQELFERENGLRYLWGTYFEVTNILPEHTPEYVIVRQPLFLEECEKIVQEAAEDLTALKAMKAYLRWHFINNIAGLLSRDFSDLHFGFYGKVLQGAHEQRPRWERVLDVISAVLGEALGELYVKRHFPPEAKQRVNELVDDLTAVYEARIRSRPWMREETKTRARAKLSVFRRKLGYPDRWRDYSEFHVFADMPYVDAYLNGSMVEFLRIMRKIDQPVDYNEWYMTPQTVNAYCDQEQNEVVFPAAILQPPFFDSEADDALNYGGIGTVIGHELTHGFDDQGSKHDEKGNLCEWWTEEDKRQFTERAAVLVKQFSACTVLGLPVNGELTLGENIADLGGLVLAYEALQRALARKGRPEAIDGFTPEQRFFLNYACIERGNIRDELARQFLMMDPHSPKHLRVNIPLSNMREFHDAFGCKEGCAMYRPEFERAEIW